jgi:hypothetical protein
VWTKRASKVGKGECISGDEDNRRGFAELLDYETPAGTISTMAVYFMAKGAGMSTPGTSGI